MSAALKDAMMSGMQASAALLAVLAKDPNDPAGEDLAIYPARMNAVKSPVYPCVTFREQSDAPDGRFRPQPPGAGLPGASSKGVTEIYYDFEAWTNLPNTRPLESIRDALDALFHQKSVPFIGGNAFFAERLTSALDNYDDTLHVWYALIRYRFRVQFQ